MSEALRLELPLLMSAVNWGEVFCMEWRYHGEAKARQVESDLHRLPIAVIGVDLDRAASAAASNKSTIWATLTPSRPNWPWNAMPAW